MPRYRSRCDRPRTTEPVVTGPVFQHAAPLMSLQGISLVAVVKVADHLPRAPTDPTRNASRSTPSRRDGWGCAAPRRAHTPATGSSRCGRRSCPRHVARDRPRGCRSIDGRVRRHVARCARLGRHLSQLGSCSTVSALAEPVHRPITADPVEDRGERAAILEVVQEAEVDRQVIGAIEGGMIGEQRGGDV